MPSSTFLNLDNNKKNKLINAAMTYFSKCNYSDVSISQIIISAEIPRGSFYMYFKDKDDLFEYLIEVEKVKLHDAIKDILIKNNGDLYNTFSELYDVISRYIVLSDYKMMFKNVFIYFGMHKSHFEKPGSILYENVKDLINKKNINEEELEFIFIMLVHNLFMGITYGINNDCLDNKGTYLRKLHILCYGIYKK